MTSPTSPRSTQSGLQRTRVRSVIRRGAYGGARRVRQPTSRNEHGAGGADDVKRPRDHDLAIGRRGQQRGADRVLDAFDDLDPLLGKSEIDRGFGNERRL